MNFKNTESYKRNRKGKKIITIVLFLVNFIKKVLEKNKKIIRHNFIVLLLLLHVLFSKKRNIFFKTTT